VVPNATADGHALNRVTADGRYALRTGATFTGAVTLPASDPTDANHAARKAYVDSEISSAIAALPKGWEKLVDIAPTNSSAIDVLGFSIQNYRMIKVLLLGVQMSSYINTAYIAARFYRNGSLLSGDWWISPSGTGNTWPVYISMEIVQAASNAIITAYLKTVYGYINPSSSATTSQFYESYGHITAGTGWLDGVRIIPWPVLQANVGRIVVMGLRP
jgi:hypothetical protein